MGRNRRTQLLINEFQGKLLWRFTAYWVFYQFTLWNFLFAWQVLREGPGNPIEQYGRFCASSYPMLFVLVFVVPFFAWDAAKFSHRVAGPIYRVQQTLRRVIDNEPVRLVSLRTNDELTEFADQVNAMLLALEDRGAVTIDRPKTKRGDDMTPGSAVNEWNRNIDDTITIDTV